MAASRLAFWVTALISVGATALLVPLAVNHRLLVMAAFMAGLGFGAWHRRFDGYASRLAGLGIAALVVTPTSLWWGWVAIAIIGVIGYSSVTHAAMSRVVPATGLLVVASAYRTGALVDGKWLALWVVAVLANLLAMTRIVPVDSTERLRLDWSQTDRATHTPTWSARSLILLVGVYGLVVPASIWSADAVYKTQGIGWLQTHGSGFGGLSGFGSRVHPGLLGGLDAGSPVTLSDEVVMRVESAQPLYWRGVTYQHWDGRYWTNPTPAPHITGHSSTTELSQYQDRFSADNQALLAADVIGDDIPSRIVRQKFTVERVGVDVLAAAWRPVAIDAPTDEFVLGVDGSVRLIEPLPTGATWTVDSQVVEATPELLRDSDPLTKPSNEELLRQYGQQQDVHPDVAKLARKITDGAPTTYDKIVALEQWFENNITYSRDIETLEPGGDAVHHLLFESRLGFCEQIGTALVVMARSLGIPARLSVGYVPSELDGSTGEWISRGTDSHAWAEVWFAGVGWQGFDPTAGVPLAGESATLASSGSIIGTLWMRIGMAALVSVVGLWLVAGRLRGAPGKRVSGIETPHSSLDRSTLRALRSVHTRLDRCGSQIGLDWTASTTVSAKGADLVEAGLDHLSVKPVIDTLRAVSYRDLDKPEMLDVQLDSLATMLTKLEGEVDRIRRSQRKQRRSAKRSSVPGDLTNSKI